MSWNQTILPIAILSAMFLLSGGCKSLPGETEQTKLAGLYYSGNLAGAAAASNHYSAAMREQHSGDALLFHLEAGNINLDAGDTEQSLRCLERAEKLIYGYDGTGRFDLHAPGRRNYSGYRSERLLLHLLKAMNYMAQGKTEDMLVEIRRMRVAQFRYLLDESDPEMKLYEQRNAGKPVAPRAMRIVQDDKDYAVLWKHAGLNSEFLEYSQRRRPELSILFNPLAFYLSAMGYYFDNEWEEAVIDLKYLHLLDPANSLYRRDFATLNQKLGDPVAKGSEPWQHEPGDQVVYVIFGEGEPTGWSNRKSSFQLPGLVPADWELAVPEAGKIAHDELVIEAGSQTYRTTLLADISEIQQEEYWQQDFPGMVGEAHQSAVATTAAHEAAKIALANLEKQKDFEGKAFLVAAARATVIATSRAYINQTEWRRWRTVPRSYQVAHVPIPQNRNLTLSLFDSAKKPCGKQTVTIGADDNRAVIYVRKLNGQYLVKYWGSKE